MCIRDSGGSALIKGHKEDLNLLIISIIKLTGAKAIIGKIDIKQLLNTSNMKKLRPFLKEICGVMNTKDEKLLEEMRNLDIPTSFYGTFQPLINGNNIPFKELYLDLKFPGLNKTERLDILKSPNELQTLSVVKKDSERLMSNPKNKEVFILQLAQKYSIDNSDFNSLYEKLVTAADLKKTGPEETIEKILQQAAIEKIKQILSNVSDLSKDNHPLLKLVNYSKLSDSFKLWQDIVQNEGNKKTILKSLSDNSLGLMNAVFSSATSSFVESSTSAATSSAAGAANAVTAAGAAASSTVTAVSAAASAAANTAKSTASSAKSAAKSEANEKLTTERSKEN